MDKVTKKLVFLIKVAVSFIFSSGMIAQKTGIRSFADVHPYFQDDKFIFNRALGCGSGWSPGYDIKSQERLYCRLYYHRQA